MSMVLILVFLTFLFAIFAGSIVRHFAHKREVSMAGVAKATVAYGPLREVKRDEQPFVSWLGKGKPALSPVAVQSHKTPLQFPKDVYYHKGHAWARVEGAREGRAVKVGLDDFAQKLAGRITGVRVPALGSALRQGDKGWSLEVDSRAIDMVSPVNGKVVAVNEEVIRSPEGLNQDPYKSWLMEVETPGFSVDRRKLFSGGLAKRWMEEIRESLPDSCIKGHG